MNILITICLVIVGIINFLPIIGVLSAAKMSQAYDVSLVSQDLIILMRHRALLFGIVGGYIIYAAFVPMYQNSAMLMGLISMLGFILLCILEGGFNASIQKLVLIDSVGLVVLAVAAYLKFSGKS